MLRIPNIAWRLVAIAVSLTSLIFIVYEMIERIYLTQVSMDVLHRLHALRGIGSTVVVSSVVAWYLIRDREHFFPEKVGTLFSVPDLSFQLNWFIHLRWLAIFVSAAAIFLSQHIFYLLPPDVTAPLWTGVGLLFFANLFFDASTANPPASAVRYGTKNRQAQVYAQMILDLFILTYLLHFSGGIENPLFVLYVFHVILAGILFPRKDAWFVMFTSSGLFLVLTMSECFHVLPHYSFTLFPHAGVQGKLIHASHHFPFVFGMSCVFIALLMGTTYFTTAIMEGLRENEVHLIRTERLSTLGQMAAYIAHEVNNPVGIISTRAKCALSSVQKGSRDSVLETLQIIDRQSDRVAKVVKSLLSLSKPQTQARTVINVNHALLDALSLAESKLKRAGIFLERALSSSSLEVYSNYNDVVHVFLNLMSNAIDATPPGGKIKVETKALDGHVEALISDTGKGIREEDLEKIFDPFFTTKPKDLGTGLGLPISLSLVKSLGGQLKVESTLGKGSTCRVILPIRKDKWNET